MPTTPPHIIVVGAGIVGASLAYHLTRQRARVTVIDKASLKAANVTAQSFAWLTAGYGDANAYVQLRQAALADWRRVEAELKGQLPVEWSGALTWFTQAADTEQVAQSLLGAGYPVQLLTPPRIQLLEPNLKSVPPHALFFPQEGALDAARTTALLLRAAQAEGATIQPSSEVLAFTTTHARLTGVVTPEGEVSGDTVVLTAGAGTVRLGQLLGVAWPVAESPAILLRFATTHRFVQRIISTPTLEIRAASDALLLAAEDYIDDSAANSPQAIASRTLASIQAQWRGAEHLRLTSAAVGQRPMPADGQPIIGRVGAVKGLYLAVMHAGVTLAALVGRLAASELVSGQDTGELAPYRLERFG